MIPCNGSHASTHTMAADNQLQTIYAADNAELKSEADYSPVHARPSFAWVIESKPQEYLMRSALYKNFFLD